MKTAQHGTPWSRNDTIGLSVIAGILAATVLLGVGPPIAESMNREEVRRQVEQNLSQAEETNATIDRVLAEKRVVDLRLEESRVTLLPLAQLNKRVMSLVDLGTQCGLDVGQITPGQPTTVRQSKVVRLTMTGTGGYGQISDFLARLHGQFLDVVVAGFSAEARRGTDPAGGAFTFELDWYAAPAGHDAGRAQ